MTTVEQAIIDTCSVSLFDDFAKLINQKAARLNKLRDINLMDWSDKYGADSTRFKILETNALEHELQILIALSEYINEMSELQEKDIGELCERIEKQNELIEVQKEYIFHSIETIISL